MRFLDYCREADEQEVSQLRKLLCGFCNDTDIALRDYTRNAKVMQQDEPCDTVQILLSGEVRVINEDAAGITYTLSNFDAIYVFGEHELFSGRDRYIASVVAVTPCRFLVINSDDYLDWLRSSSRIMFERAQVLVKQLVGDLVTERQNLFNNSDYRLRRLLVEYYEAATVQKNGEVVVNMSRAVMSENMGYCLRTVNRAVKRLTKQNCISLDRGKIGITAEQYRDLQQSLQSYQ